MGREWENPRYEYQRQQRRRSLFLLAAFLLVIIVLAAAALLRRGAPGGDTAPAGGQASRPEERPPSNRFTAIPDPVPRSRASPPLGGNSGDSGDAAPLPGGAEELAPMEPAAGGEPGPGFAELKAEALRLYRQNELAAARERIEAALALRADEELLALRERLEQEIRVQRDYDDERTAHFVVLFDGYEHEEIRKPVLDILKEAYAEIGKELDHFPGEPITVILYTGKDFSDVTRAPEWAGGMFGKLDGKIRLPAQGIGGQEAALRRVLTHEFVHALLHDLAPASPLWLHEGLAQYFSGDDAVSVPQLIPLPMLASGFPREARQARLAYAESLQAVTDLVDEHGMPPLRRLLNGLGEGRGLEQAFAAAYGEPFSRWVRGWRPVERGE